MPDKKQIWLDQKHTENKPTQRNLISHEKQCFFCCSVPPPLCFYPFFSLIFFFLSFSLFLVFFLIVSCIFLYFFFIFEFFLPNKPQTCKIEKHYNFPPCRRTRQHIYIYMGTLSTPSREHGFKHRLTVSFCLPSPSSGERAQRVPISLIVLFGIRPICRLHFGQTFQNFGKHPGDHNHQDFPKSIAIRMGGVLQYKWEAYCNTNGRSTESISFFRV